MKSASVAVLIGAVLLLVGITALVANVAAGTIWRLPNLAVVMGTLFCGLAGVCGGVFSAITTLMRWRDFAISAATAGISHVTDAVAQVAPDAVALVTTPATTVWVFEPQRGKTGQFEIAAPTQRDYDALYHLAARANETDDPDLQKKIYAHCDELSQCLFQLHHTLRDLKTPKKDQIRA